MPTSTIGAFGNLAVGGRYVAAVRCAATFSLVSILAASFAFSLWSLFPQPTKLLETPLLPAELREPVSLQEALATIAKLPKEGFVLFGVEVRLKDGKQPSVRVLVKPRATLGEALQGLLSQIPDYKMQVVSDHLIDIHPTGAEDDPGDVLNLRVPRFAVDSKPAYAILEAPKDVIPQLKEALSPKPQPGKVVIELYAGGYHGGTRITLDLKNVTVREILNATSVATEASFESYKPAAPRGWICVIDPSASSEALKFSFNSYFSMPSYWHVTNSGDHNRPEQ